MTTMTEAKRNSENVSGVSNVAFDLLALLENKLEGIAAMEEYKFDCEDAGDREVRQLIETMQSRDSDDISKLRDMLKQRL